MLDHKNCLWPCSECCCFHDFAYLLENEFLINFVNHTRCGGIMFVLGMVVVTV